MLFGKKSVVGLTLILSTVVGLSSCSERSKKEEPKKSAEITSADTPSKKYTRKIVPQLRSIFSILSKVMIIAERANGSSDDTKNAIGILEDLSSETAIGKVTPLSDGLSQVEVSLIFGRVIAQKKADITIVVIGKESSDDFIVKEVGIQIDHLEGAFAGTSKSFTIVSTSKSAAGENLQKFKLSDIEELSHELNYLNSKIRVMNITGDLDIAFNKNNLIATSAGLKWEDKVLKYNLSSLKLVAEFESEKPIKEVVIDLKAESTKADKPLLASIKLNTKNATLQELDKGFVVEKH